jgi:hypothetical protein
MMAHVPIMKWSTTTGKVGSRKTVLRQLALFSLAFAPDVYHKVNVSGGTPYAIILPNAGADALIEIYGKQSYFVDYLRECFKWGGFPGFGDKEKGRDNGTIVELVVGLLDI